MDRLDLESATPEFSGSSSRLSAAPAGAVQKSTPAEAGSSSAQKTNTIIHLPGVFPGVDDYDNIENAEQAPLPLGACIAIWLVAAVVCWVGVVAILGIIAKL